MLERGGAAAECEKQEKARDERRLVQWRAEQCRRAAGKLADELVALAELAKRAEVQQEQHRVIAGA
ncbi:MAG TPA: hypothetical protein VF551_06650, partial [Chthoniobacterales bacterium]